MMKKRIWILFTLLAAIIPLILIIASSVIVNSFAKGKIYRNADKIPHNHVGLLLGCSKKLRNGRDNLFFKYRIQAAVELFKAKKINYIVVSGDNSIVGYDEPTDMKKALMKKGIPSSHIYCDYAGFRTLDSVMRVKRIFKCHKITIISQEFHNKRAIFIAKNKGIDAIGYNAKEVRIARSFKTKLRELFARVKTLMDVYLLKTQPKFGGPEIRIPKRN